ncbi:ATP-binding protein [Streptomyces sp. CBMA29]|uniref:ATP-binding protein n=1 Tax=Streptomyces sp. CBMA29 TaxID=1896314 RepID=UPI001661EAD5|nr:ATP-binding protein [Streptomyces sp. CBMA29]MBD0737146.1 regulator [Streptomyces sp. CBMA29]
MPEIPRLPALWRFPARPESVRRARHAVAEALEALPCGVEPQLAADLGLVTSELVTNAVRHGARCEEDAVIELVLWPADGHYWVAVSDGGAEKPELAEAGPECEGGRGLVLIDALAEVWGVVPRPVRGKSVVAGLGVRSGPGGVRTGGWPGG